MFDFTAVLFSLTWTGVLLLSAIGIFCLVCCKGKLHTCLLFTAGVFLWALSLFFGGEILLGFFQMTWRNRSSLILCGTLLVSGWIGIVLTLGCFLPLQMSDLSDAMRRTAKGILLCLAVMMLFMALWCGWIGIVLALGCLLLLRKPDLPAGLWRAIKGIVLCFAVMILFMALWFGPLLLAFGFGAPEQKIEYQGQTLVEVDDGFLDSHYSYYVYHGPLVRGTERIYDSPTPIYGGTE